MIIGLVGKPSAGKSTFFKAATLAEVEIANYPFTTLAPNEGIGYVKVECVDKEFNTKCQPRMGYCIDGIRFVPVQMIDVAGLVPEAHLGKGKGGQVGAISLVVKKPIVAALPPISKGRFRTNGSHQLAEPDHLIEGFLAACFRFCSVSGRGW